jgi:RNA polymerase sigma-70 factor (ECF subfamily)
MLSNLKIKLEKPDVAVENEGVNKFGSNGSRKIPQLSDSEVLKFAADGDNQAFGELYDRYVSRIYNYIYYRTGNQHDAEDLTARVFYRALRHITNYQDRGLPISAWLYRIAHNLVANWHRDNSRRKEIPLDDGYNVLKQSGLPPEAALERTEEQEELLQVLRRLPEERQQLIILKFVEHLPNAEIGRIMGRTEGAIKSLYHRTLIALRDEYQVKSG